MPSSSLNYTHIDEYEYLEGEKLADIRHEYVDGQVYAMAGTSKRHNRIAGNIYRALISSGQKNCDVYIGDIKVRIEQRNSYYYPDVMVGCNEADDADEYYLEKPCLLVEILSPSTEKKDSTEKLLAYQEIASLQAYLMVEQDNCHVSFIYRQKNDHWWVKNFTRLDDIISLQCPEMELSVADIYERIM
jgi:Uma2 family endonuclease